jgi:predicted ribonuclease YlaK
VIKNRLSKTLLPTYSKIVFIVNNSVIQSRKELGFLPGSKHEKILPFMSGIIDNLEFLFNGHINSDFDITKTDFNDWFEIRPV